VELHHRIRQLFEHHGIERAHFVGGGFVYHLTDLAMAAPDLVASVTLVCPHQVPLTLASDLTMPLNIISGDRGRGAEMVDQVLARVAKPDRVVLADCEPLLWDDMARERAAELLDGIAGFLARIDPQIGLDSARPADATGIVAELPYQSKGAGKPVVFFPLGLAPGQWGPLIDRLSERYAVFSVTGVHTPPTSLLETRAATPGYRAILRSMVDRLELSPDARLFEVGCGTGAVCRWLAEQTRVARPIMGIDLNPYLLSEAEILRDSAGFSDDLEFMEGDAHALPFEANSFDATLSITLLEEVDADRALAEMVRVTRPGGRVAVAVRALDIAPVVGAALPEAIRSKAVSILNAAGVGKDGCADASLYRRMVSAGLTGVQPMPQFNPSMHLLHKNEGRSGLDGFDAGDKAIWVEAVEAAGDAFFIAQPMHAAVGTKPFEVG
jgi:SAM-dependent methyltransferase